MAASPISPPCVAVLALSHRLQADRQLLCVEVGDFARPLVVFPPPPRLQAPFGWAGVSSARTASSFLPTASEAAKIYGIHGLFVWAGLRSPADTASPKEPSRLRSTPRPKASFSSCPGPPSASVLTASSMRAVATRPRAWRCLMVKPQGSSGCSQGCSLVYADFLLPGQRGRMLQRFVCLSLVCEPAAETWRRPACQGRSTLQFGGSRTSSTAWPRFSSTRLPLNPLLRRQTHVLLRGLWIGGPLPHC